MEFVCGNKMGKSRNHFSFLVAAIIYLELLSDFTSSFGNDVSSLALSTPKLRRIPAPLTHFSNSIGLTLYCEVWRNLEENDYDHNAPVTISWLDSSSLQQVTNIPGVREQLGNGSLHIFPFKEGEYLPHVHNGAYRCSVRNPVGTFLSPAFSIRAVMDHPFEVVIRSEFETSGESGQGQALLFCDIHPSFYSPFKRLISWKEIDRFGHAKEIHLDHSRYLMNCDGSLLILLSPGLHEHQNHQQQQLFICVVENILNGKRESSPPFLFKEKGRSESGSVSLALASAPKSVLIRKLCEKENNVVEMESRESDKEMVKVDGEMERVFTVELLCLVEGGNTGASFRWEKFEENTGNFVPVLLGGEEGRKIVQIGPILRITSSLRDSQGIYKCETSNSLGAASGNFSVGDLDVAAGSRNKNIEWFLPKRMKRIFARDGQNVEFSCEDDGRESSGRKSAEILKFSWFKNGKLLIPGKEEGRRGNYKFSSKLGKLQIFGVAFGDQGVYQCFSETGAEEEALSSSAELIFPSTPPELLNTFISQSLQPGPGVSFKCSAVGNPPPEIFWFIDGFKITGESKNFHPLSLGESRESTFSGEVVSFLNISEVRVENSGVYSCVAVNLISSVEHAARLNVYGRIFVKQMEGKTLPHGETVQIHCPFGGWPVDRISWEKDGFTIENSNRFFVFPNGTLQIGQISTESDKGTYTCTVSNRRGETASGFVTVDVMRAPIISSVRFDEDLREGQRTSASCNVISGDLPMEIQWKKDGIPINPGKLNATETKLKFLNVLSFEELKGEHSGVYTCSAGNAVATVKQSASLQVKVSPKWRKLSFEKNVKVVLKSDKVLLCEVSGVPFPVVKWFREEEKGVKIQIFNQSNKFLLGENGQSLKVFDVEESNAFQYVCEASNGVGKTISRSIKMEVIIPAKVSAVQKTVTVAEGGSASLQCQIRGDRPVEVIWKRMEASLSKSSPLLFLKGKEDGLFTEEKITEVNSTVILAQLQIQKASLSQSGIYLCTAANQFGRDEKEIKLEVKARPVPPEGLRVEEIGSRFIRLRWSSGGKKGLLSSVPVTHFFLQWRISESKRFWENVEENAFYFEGKEKIFNMSVQFPSNQALLRALFPVTSYQIRIFACNAIGKSLASEVLSVVTLPEAPSGPPTNVSAVAISPKSILVKWEPPEESLQHGIILGYKVAAVFQSDVSGNWEGNNGSVIFEEKWAQQSELKGLRPNSQYRVAVKAYNGAGVGPESSPVFIQTSEGAPDSPPLNLQCESLSPKSLQVQWDPPPMYLSNGQIVGYKVFYNPTNAASFSFGSERGEVKKTSNRETTLHGLKSYQSYAVKVLAYTSGGESEPSQPVNCRTEEDVPGEPADVKVLVSGTASLLVSWLPPSTPNGRIKKYTIYWRVSDDNGIIKEKHVLPSPPSSAFSAEMQLSTEIRKLKENLQYIFWITATTAAGVGMSSKSETIYFSLSNNIPARIASFPVTKNVQKDHLSLRLPCKVVGSPLPKVTWLKDNHLFISPFQLRNGSIFISKVKDEDEGKYVCQVENEFGSDSIQHRIIINRAPSAVQQLSIGYVTDTSLHCHWEPPVTSNPSISGYILEFKHNNSDWEFVKLSNILTSYSLEGLLCGTHYHLKLTAENSVGKGEPSAILKARTNGHPPSSSPRLTEILDGNGTMIRIDLRRWPDEGCPIKNFHIEYKKESDSKGDSWKRIYKRDNDTKVFVFGSQDEPNSKYRIKIKVENDGGSAIKTFFVENHPDFFRNYAKVLERVELEEKSNGNGGSGKGADGNSNFIPFYADPHVLVPIVSAVICTLAITACILIVLRRKNQSSKPDWRLDRQQQPSWLGSCGKFGDSNIVSGKCEDIAGTEESLSIYATLNSAKAIPNTIRDSTVRLHSFAHQDNYEAASLSQKTLPSSERRNNRRKSLRSSSDEILEEVCMEPVISCQLDYLPDKIEPPREFRSSVSSSHQNIYHVHHHHRQSRHPYQNPEDDDNSNEGDNDSDDDDNHLRGTVRLADNNVAILHSEYSSPYQLSRVPSGSRKGSTSSGRTLKKNNRSSSSAHPGHSGRGSSAAYFD